ncbi:MAG: M64 family metallo-endopeptidase, partial [Firmicutes bacterium]|nr:M64 family metallo-endopeptidase [Bacillota bacterium]
MKRIILKLLLITALFGFSFVSIGFIFDDGGDYRSTEIRGGYTINDIRQMVGEQSPNEYLRVHNPYYGVNVHKVSNNFPNIASSVMPLSFSYARERIRYSGMPNSESIVVVLMGDGFAAGQQGIFLNHARSATNFMMNMYPFNLFSDIFTVYAIQTVSEQSGVSVRHGNSRREINNRFGSYLPIQDEVTMYSGSHFQIRQIAAYYAGGSQNVNMIHVIANTTAFGGSAWTAHHLTNPVVGISLTTVHTNHGGWHRTFIHEFGHSFGSLADERGNVNGRDAPNMTALRNNNRWSHWIGREQIQSRSITASGGGQWFIPRGHSTFLGFVDGGCIMAGTHRTLTCFCAVCAAELVRRMAQHHSGETFYPRGSTQQHVTVLQNPRNRILPYAFNGNTDLQSVRIPQGITTIGQYSFLGATNLRRIYNMNETPQFLPLTAFSGLARSNIELRVPTGTATSFFMSGWFGFNIVEYPFFDNWHQPRFTSNSNGHGVITASGYYAPRSPFGAFDGWRGTVAEG